MIDIDPYPLAVLSKIMNFSPRPCIIGICLLIGFGQPAESLAQVSNVNVQIANLRSDVDRLDQIVRVLKLEVEALRRENRQLQDWARSEINSSAGDYVTRAQLNQLLKEFELRVQAANVAGREVLVNEVSREIEALAEQTQKAIAALAKSVEGQPAMDEVIVFNDDYPQSGTTYTVQSGDSLSRIARDHGSTVAWIRNANRLASDIIYPGQELFIPLKKD